MGVPMITTNAGGIVDLIHASDHSKVVVTGSTKMEKGAGYSSAQRVTVDSILIDALTEKLYDFLAKVRSLKKQRP